MKLINTENILVGKWIFENGKMQKDQVTQRIDLLVNNYLKKITSNGNGWDALYEDTNDGRFWELTYPQSELHGGGPPSLINISEEEAIKKYLNH
jgi:Immunity protein 27